MTKVGRPKRLIGYDNDINIHRRQEGKAPIYRIVRARTVVYSAIIAAVGGIMLYALATRSLDRPASAGETARSYRLGR